eukprot:gnl/Spiro4/7319_TR3833_c0_g1_i1.p1 gnl/Spiro4/7319_TR3833_c0_g1~~gnl/Spiro4/7319_TR3833_c0_g1_i1.p1  ORF type:complete len:485 (-),score=121.37 gnl/Spiro4/7319_TR3833_c0_g1_i1:19-1473(-)
MNLTWGPPLSIARFWGLTPSTDLAQCVPPPSDSATVNFLLAGTGDLQHVFHTLHDWTSTAAPRFHIVEAHMATIARQLLWLSIALDESIPVEDSCKMLLEMYGNVTLEPCTQTFLAKHAAEVSRFLDNAGSSRAGPLGSVADISGLQYKQLDELRDCVQSWTSNSQCEIENMWDVRLRAFFRERFDVRENLIDWDYHMKVNDPRRLDAGLIHRHMYMRWRMRGEAFIFPEHVSSSPSGGVSVPNRTLCSDVAYYSSQARETVATRGFFGDIMNSPYVAYGIRTTNQDLLKKVAHEGGHIYAKSAQDVALHHLCLFFTKIRQRRSAGELSFRVLFMGQDLASICTRRPMQALCDVVFLGGAYAHAASGPVPRIVRPSGRLVIELARYLVELSDESKSVLLNRVQELLYTHWETLPVSSAVPEVSFLFATLRASPVAPRPPASTTAATTTTTSTTTTTTTTTTTAAAAATTTRTATTTATPTTPTN